MHDLTSTSSSIGLGCTCFQNSGSHSQACHVPCEILTHLLLPVPCGPSILAWEGLHCGTALHGVGCSPFLPCPLINVWSDHARSLKPKASECVAVHSFLLLRRKGRGKKSVVAGFDQCVIYFSLFSFLFLSDARLHCCGRLG